jgi:CBS domain-containing protein/anti-sigma regulatory factor (Ser/Thr protein kinase)
LAINNAHFAPAHLCLLLTTKADARRSWDVVFEQLLSGGAGKTLIFTRPILEDDQIMESVSAHYRRTANGSIGFITRVEELAYELKIAEVMTRKIKTVIPETKMAEVLELFREARISGAPVMAEDQLVGVISLEDLINALRDLGRSELKSVVADYMTTDVITVNTFDPIVEALKLFTKTSLGRLPVIDERRELAGILTKGDISRGLLDALQRDYQVEEVRRYRASHLFEDIESDRTGLILRYQIKQGDFTHGGAASSKIKQALLRLGADPQVARRCGIAIYEAEMNLIIHTTYGGEIRVEVEPHQISLETIDEGPGIKDVNLVMQPGYSTASEEIRELGFGAGMGLANIRRSVDEMLLESTPGKGSRLTMKIKLQPEQTFRENRRR